MHQEDLRILVRTLVAELVVYAALVVGYTFLVLRWLSEPLHELFQRDLLPYAVLSLGLMVAQGAVLDAITSFLLSLLPTHRRE